MIGYVPTTEQVRDAYVRAMRNAFIASAGEHEAEFNRWLEQVRAEERERCLKAVERQAPEMGRDINISQYREGLNDGVWRAVSAIDRLAAIRAVSEQEEH